MWTADSETAAEEESPPAPGLGDESAIDIQTIEINTKQTQAQLLLPPPLYKTIAISILIL